jgi:hypothetical protein
MQIIKPIIVLTVALFFFQSCSDKSKADKPCRASYEIDLANMHDTVNKIDCNCLKQGKWVPNKENKMTATTYYRNDTIVDSQ